MIRTASLLAVALLLVLLGGAAARPAAAGCSPSYFIHDHAPTWSPTGERIAFERHDIGCGRPVFASVMRSDGREQRRLGHSGFGHRLGWTPDGASVALDVSYSPDGSRLTLVTGFPSHVFVQAAGGGDRRPLTTGPGEANPAWSPRGDRIAFEVTGGIDVVLPDGGGRRAVWRGEPTGAGFSWSPDGTRIALLRRSDVRYSADRLHLVDVDRGVGADIASGSFVEHAPAWRPDGQQLAVTRRLPPQGFDEVPTEIVTVRPDGSNLRVFGPGAELTWSPDGSRVAFVWNGHCPSTRLGVYVGSGDGLESRRLTNDCQIFGGSEADVLRGTPDDDVLSGMDGDDRLLDGYGEDLLAGGAGNDRLDGGEQADLLLGGTGNDVLVGGGGRDLIYGGPGLDRIQGGIAKDRIEVRDGERDIVACGPQDDLVVADRIDQIARDCERVLA